MRSFATLFNQSSGGGSSAGAAIEVGQITQFFGKPDTFTLNNQTFLKNGVTSFDFNTDLLLNQWWNKFLRTGSIPNGFGGNSNAIYALNNAGVLVAARTSNGAAARSVNSGKDWSELTTFYGNGASRDIQTDGNNLFIITSENDDRIYGTSQNAVLRVSTNAGNTWSTYGCGYDRGSVLNAVAIGSRCVAVGYAFQNGLGESIPDQAIIVRSVDLQSHWVGVNIDQLGIASNSRLNTVVTDKNGNFVAGGSVGNIPLLLRSIDNGASWERLPVTGINREIGRLYISTTGTIICRSWDQWLQSTNLGTTWQPITIANGISTITHVKDKHWIAAGRITNLVGNEENQFWNSFDDGITWSPVVLSEEAKTALNSAFVVSLLVDRLGNIVIARNTFPNTIFLSQGGFNINLQAPDAATYYVRIK